MTNHRDKPKAFQRQGGRGCESSPDETDWVVR